MMFGRKLNTQDQNIFITSDLHFGHKSILNFCANTRPWKDLDKMHEALIKEWNSLVGENDYIFHLGDFSFKGKEFTESILSQLNGKIVCIFGNHDKCLRNQIDKSRFNIVDMCDYLELRIDSAKICMSHYPLTTWNQSGRGSLQFFGHCHGSLPQPVGRQVDVGYDNWGKIINIKEAIDFCMKREIYSPDHHKVIED